MGYYIFMSEDLKKKIEQLEAEIKQLKSRKKYGLVWEDKPEDVVEQCKKELPVLEEVEDQKILKNKDGKTNLIIEGDNYHALSVLNYTHKGKIDVIYIDPPYNTGNKDFIYNDDYVDLDDSYRHSKWVSFMYKRLRMAEQLLSDDGFLAVSIDDNEIAQLKMLLDEIFHGNTKIVTVKMSEASGLKMGATKKTGNIPKYKEYVIFAKQGGVRNLRFEPINKKEWDQEYNTIFLNFTKKDRDLYDRLSSKEELNETDLVTMDKVLSKIELASVSSQLITEGINGNEEIMEWKLNNAWRIVRTAASSSVKKLADEKRRFVKGRSIFSVISSQEKNLYIVKGDYSKKSKSPRIQYLFADDNLRTHPGDWWSAIKTTGLEAEGNISFKNGKKPLDLIKKIIYAHKNDDAFVLDFFAGSGTTAEAVIQLNREKGGERAFIINTYNEENGNGKIIDSYCYPRLKSVSEGYGNNPENNFNLRYFKTTFVKKSNVSDDVRKELVSKSTEMICVKESTYDKKYDNKNYKIYINNDIATGILFNLDEIDDFKNKLEKVGMESHIYVFSLSNDTFDSDFEDLSVEYSLIPIPESILEVYRKLFA